MLGTHRAWLRGEAGRKHNTPRALLASGSWDLYPDPVTSNKAGRGHLRPEGMSVLLLAGFSAFLTDHAQPSVGAFLNRSLSSNVKVSLDVGNRETVSGISSVTTL